MNIRLMSEDELTTHIEDLAGSEARRAVAERLAADAWAEGARSVADLDARWSTDDAFFAAYAAASAALEAE